MRTMTDKTRLYVEHELGTELIVALSANQARYLHAVLRMREGDSVALFNGRDGEWSSTLINCDRKVVRARCVFQSRPQDHPPDLWLLFAPIKKSRSNFVVEKATELGVSEIHPVLTEFSNTRRTATSRLESIAKEAAEQCHSLYVPRLFDLKRLDETLNGWCSDRRLLFCDEARNGDLKRVSGRLPAGPWAILTGPEGGFSERERRWLRNLPFAHPVSLGPRILRAETAATVAIAMWHRFLSH